MHYCLGINGTVLLGEEQRIPSCYKELLRIDSKAIRLTLCTTLTNSCFKKEIQPTKVGGRGMLPILPNVFQKTEEKLEETLLFRRNKRTTSLGSYSEVSITWIPKPHKVMSREENHRSVSLMNRDAKILTKYLKYYQIKPNNVCIKGIITMAMYTRFIPCT